MSTLSFNGCVNIAVRIVSEKYPDAKLYEADGVATGGPTTEPTGIDSMRVVFQNSDNTTVVISTTTWGEFGEPEQISQPWLGDRVIDWPIDMDLPKANQLKQDAGYNQPYTTVTLRNPLGPKKTNPFFIFGTGHLQPFVFVDVVTGEVSSGN